MKSARKCWGALAIIAFVLAFAAGGLKAADLVVSGLVGLWELNDGSGVLAADSSGLGDNGYLVGSAYFANDPQMGQVLEIAGPSGAMIVPHSPTLEPAKGTIMIWVKPSRTQVSEIVSKNTSRLVRRGQDYGAYAYDLRITKAGAPVAIITNDDPAAEYPWTYLEGPKGKVKKNHWTHLAMRWDGNNLSIFVNGQQVASKPYVPVPGAGLSYFGNNDLKLGAAIWDFGDGWLEYSGDLSDFRFYGRALTDAEILGAYGLKAAAAQAN